MRDVFIAYAGQSKKKEIRDPLKNPNLVWLHKDSENFVHRLSLIVHVVLPCSKKKKKKKTMALRVDTKYNTKKKKETNNGSEGGYQVQHEREMRI